MRYPLKPFQRLALLEAWDEKCAWCGRPLRYDEVCVDHLLPQDLANASEGFKQDVFASLLPLELRQDATPFDLHGLSNLAPSCSRDNRLKSAQMAPVTALLLEAALNKVKEIEELAEKFKGDRQMQRALAIIASLDQSARGEAVARLVGEGIDTSIIRRLVRLNIAYGVVEYENDGEDTTVRRLWLVMPPNQQPLAVVLEDPGDSGTSIQNAAERIAETLFQQYPGFLTVLHYDQEDHEPWANVWKPVPTDSRGKGQFWSVSDDIRDRMVNSLVAADLILDSEDARRAAMSW